MLAGVSPRLSNYSIYPIPYLVRLRTHFFRLVESGRNPSQVSQNIGAVSAGKLSSAPICEQSRKSIGILQINRCGEPVLRQNLVTIDIVDFLRPSATLYRYEGIT